MANGKPELDEGFQEIPVAELDEGFEEIPLKKKDTLSGNGVPVSSEPQPIGATEKPNPSLDRRLPYLKEQAAKSFAERPDIFSNPNARQAYYDRLSKPYSGRDYFKVRAALMEVDPYAKKEAQEQAVSAINPVGETIPTAIEAAAHGITEGVKQGAKTKEVIMKEGIASGTFNAAVATGKTILGAAGVLIPELAAYNVATQGLEQTAPEIAQHLSPITTNLEKKYKEVGIPVPKWKENWAAVGDFALNLAAGLGLHYTGKLSPVEAAKIIEEAPAEKIKEAAQKTDEQYTAHQDEQKVSDLESDIAKNPASPVTPILQKEATDLHTKISDEQLQRAQSAAELTNLQDTKAALEKSTENLSETGKQAVQPTIDAVDDKIKQSAEQIKVSETPEIKDFTEAITANDKAVAEGMQFNNPAEYDRFVSENSESPLELAESYVTIGEYKNQKSYLDEMLEEYPIKITQKDFERYGDPNLISPVIAKRWFDKKAEPLDTQLKELSETIGVEVTEQDFINHILGTEKSKPSEYASLRTKFKNRFYELTGQDLTPKLAKKIIEEHGKTGKVRIPSAKVREGIKRETLQDVGGEKKTETPAEPTGTVEPQEITPLPPEIPKEEGESSPQGKKALESRVYEGKTPDAIKESIKKHGLTYDIETHPEAEAIARSFINDVGIDNAVEVVRKGEIKGGAATLIKGMAIDAVHKEYLTEKNPELKEQLLQKETELFKELGEGLRTKGQEISAAQVIYQTSDVGYYLGSILERAKEANQGEAISEVLKNRLTETSKKLDEVSEKLAEKEKQQAEYSEEAVIEAVEKELNKFYEKMPTERKRRADKIIAALDELETELSGKAFASIIPIPVLKLAIRTIKIAIKGGVNLADAIQLGIDKIREKHKDFDEGKFKEFAESWFKEKNLEFKGTKTDLEKYQANLKKAIHEYERRLREKDFEPRKKGEPLTLDEETFQLQVEKNKLKDEVDLEIEKLKLRNRPLGEKIQAEFVDVLNLPKSLVASADMSAPLRQGAVLSARHPIMATQAAREMFKQAFSEKASVDWLARLKSTPEYATMKEAGLYFAEPTAKLSAKEEQFISNIAHKIPIWGRIVKGSERAYTGYLNKLRADVFAQFHDALVRDGIKGERLNKELESFADFVNNASGRGNLGRFEESTAVLNAAFFSPRYATSRFNLLNPYKYVKMSPRARAEALKTVGAYVGVGATVLALAQAGGASVNTDPRSSDFGKIRIGNTRFDIWAGFQQWVRLITQLATGEKTTLDGKVQKLGQGYKTDTRLDIAERFLRTKASPTFGFGMDVLAGKNVVGQPVTFKFNDLNSFVESKEGQLIIPLWLQDLRDAAEYNSAGVATGVALSSFFGVGTSTYEDKSGAPDTGKIKVDKEKVEKVNVEKP